MDLFNNLNFKPAFYPIAAVTDNTPAVSEVCDMADLESCVLAMVTGTESDADAVFTTTAKESDTGLFAGEETTCNAADLLGTTALASFVFSDDKKCFKLGFRASGKRYKQVTVTPTGNTGNFFLGGIWVRQPRNKPTVNPPA